MRISDWSSDGCSAELEVGKSYMKGMAEAALHQRARLLLLRGRERRRNHHPLLDFVQAALDELEPPNLWRDRLVVVVIAEVGKHRRAVRQRQAVALAADDPPDHRQDRKSTRLNSSH